MALHSLTLRLLIVTACLVSPWAGGWAAEPKAAPKPAEPNKQIVAYIYSDIPITREEYGEFLIARGGMDKLEFLIKKRIIDIEAERRKVIVTELDVDAGLREDLIQFGFKADEFEKTVLPRYGKTLFEWREDVIRPRLQLCKMCSPEARDGVTDEAIARLFETRYGERREAKIIVWPKSGAEKALTPEEKEAARASAIEFDKLAARQPDVNLRQAGGLIAPIGRHIDGEDPAVEAALFNLKLGETVWVETEKTSTCLQCVRIIPPEVGTKLDEKMREKLRHDLVEKAVNARIGGLFAELKAKADAKMTTQVPLPPSVPNTPPPVRIAVADPRILAVLQTYRGPLGVTREDLGEYLIARAGADRIDLFVNRRIIEVEANRRGLTVTPEELEATIIDDLRGLGLGQGIEDKPDVKPQDAAKQMKALFEKHMLPRYGKTMFEWTEDAIKPRILLGKMCRDQVKSTDDDLQKAFVNKYGEKRAAQVIIWPKEQARVALRAWEEIRASVEAYDREARAQSDKNLASRAGHVLPMGRNTDADNTMVEDVLFTLKVGEVSHLFETPTGIVCVKCTRIDPPVTGVSMAAVRPALEKVVYERKLAKAVPACFLELKKTANPFILFKGPSARENAEGVKHLIELAGLRDPVAAPQKK